MATAQPSAQSETTDAAGYILILTFNVPGFFDDVFGPLLGKIAARTVLKRASDSPSALRYLADGVPTAIIVFDPDIIKYAHSTVLQYVMSYVRGGGIAIFTGTFTTSLQPDDLSHFFRWYWGLPWEKGDVHRTTVHLNRRVEAVPHSGLPPAYSLEGVFLKNVTVDMALYLPSENSHTEWGPFLLEPVADLTQTPAAFALIENGYLGYVGDVEQEVESDAVILAMCRLPVHAAT